MIVPSSSSSAAEAAKAVDGSTAHFSLQNLVAEAHLWGGAAFDDTITAWFELTFSSDGVDVEHAQLLFNDIVGPKHLFNVIVGHGFPNVTQYGPHSSYLADQLVTALGKAAIGVFGLIYRQGDPFMGFFVLLGVVLLLSTYALSPRSTPGTR